MRFLGSLIGLLVAFAQPALAATTPELQPLERRLAGLANENPGEFGFAALDLSTGDSVSFNGHRAFPMASTVKIAIAATYLSQVDNGRRSLYDTVGGTSPLSLMESMLIHSNNRSTDLLLASLGGPSVVDSWLRNHQLSGIRVDRTIAQLLSDRRDLRDIRDSSTPMAMIDLLRLIDTGNALSRSSRSLLLDMMRRCATGSNRMRGLLPPGAGVEHKTGTLNGYTGDVGFLTLADGRRIAVVFFARGGSNRPAVISTAARAIYDGFSAPGLAGRYAGQYARPYGDPYGGRAVQANSYQSGYRASGVAPGRPYSPSPPQSPPYVPAVPQSRTYAPGAYVGGTGGPAPTLRAAPPSPPYAPAAPQSRTYAPGAYVGGTSGAAPTSRAAPPSPPYVPAPQSRTYAPGAYVGGTSGAAPTSRAAPPSPPAAPQSRAYAPGAYVGGTSGAAPTSRAAPPSPPYVPAPQSRTYAPGAYVGGTAGATPTLREAPPSLPPIVACKLGGMAVAAEC